jgi:hypothetical protein
LRITIAIEKAVAIVNHPKLNIRNTMYITLTVITARIVEYSSKAFA